VSWRIWTIAGDVEHVVEAAVAGAGQPVPDMLAGGGVDGGGAGPGGEPVAVGETGHIVDIGEDPGGAGRADPEDLQQCAAAGDDVLAQPAEELLQFAVEGVDLADQLGGQRPAGPPGGVLGAHRAE